MAKRKIKQIAVTETIDYSHAPEKIHRVIYALCQDGTLWCRCTIAGDIQQSWEQIEGPPRDKA